jgi:hypothetical protein
MRAHVSFRRSEPRIERGRERYRVTSRHGSQPNHAVVYCNHWAPSTTKNGVVARRFGGGQSFREHGRSRDCNRIESVPAT